MSRAQFIDISGFQSLSIDFVKYRAWSAAADGIARLAIKTTEGVGFTDPHYQAYRQGALAAGIDCLLLYHFSRADLGNTPQNEAAWQAKVLGDLRPTDIIMLDVETAPTSADWVYQWCVAQQKNYPNNQIVIYSYPNFITQHLQDKRLAQFPLYLAAYQFDPNETPPCPPPWTNYAFLQYTDKLTNVPGIPGTVDADVYVGGIDMPEKTIDISEVSQWFIQVNATTWQAKDPKSHQPDVDANGQPLLVRDGILTYLRAGRSSDAQYGNFSRVGLPVSNERSPQSGVAEQTFERAVIRWDPNHVADNPPGVGQCYPIHLDPYYAAVTQLPLAVQQVKDTQTQLTQCQNTLKLTGQQLKDAQAAISSADGYGLACNDIADRLKTLPRYPTPQEPPQGHKKP